MLAELAEQIYRKLYPGVNDRDFRFRMIQEIQEWLVGGPVPDVPDVDDLAVQFREDHLPPEGIGSRE